MLRAARDLREVLDMRAIHIQRNVFMDSIIVITSKEHRIIEKEGDKMKFKVSKELDKISKTVRIEEQDCKLIEKLAKYFFMQYLIG